MRQSNAIFDDPIGMWPHLDDESESSHLICIFAQVLRGWSYEDSDLLSSLYAASRAQVTFGPT